MTRSTGTERAWREWLLARVRQRYPAIWRHVLREALWCQQVGSVYPPFGSERLAFFAGAEHGAKEVGT